MNSSGLIGFVVVIAFGVCMVGSFVAAAALGSVRKAKLPRYRRLRGFFLGTGLGGLAAFLVMPLIGSTVNELSDWLAGVLVRQGVPKSVFEWSNLYLISGGLFAGMAAGAGIGWWLTRERVR
jgi:hypothetical protein